MPVITIPLVGQFTQRRTIPFANESKDQRYVAGHVQLAPDPIGGANTAFFEKRLRWSEYQTPSVGDFGTAILRTKSSDKTYSAFLDSVSTNEVFEETVSCGIVDGNVLGFTEAVLDGVTHVLCTDDNGGGWFIPEDSVTNRTFTGNFTLGATTVTSVSSFTGIYVGQALDTAGAQAAAGARVASLDTGSNLLVMTIAAGASGTGTTVTREAIAKIIDADFPSNAVGVFAELDGRVFVMTATGRIYQSALNDPSSWSATEFVTADKVSDDGATVFGYRNHIVAFGDYSIEWFYNNGNSSGSVLSRNDALTTTGIGTFTFGGNPAVSVANDMLFFLGNPGLKSIYVMDGFKPRNIMPQGVWNHSPIQIETFSAYSKSGKTFVQMGGTPDGSTSSTIEYCVDTNTWSETDYTASHFVTSGGTGGGSTDSIYAIRAGGAVGANSGKTYVKNITSNENSDDDGTAFSLIVQTQPYYLNNGNPFTVHEVELIGDTQSSGFTTLSSFSDDYTTEVIRGAFDMTNQRKVVKRCGYHRTHVAFKLKHSANTTWRAQAIKVRWSPAVGREI